MQNLEGLAKLKRPSNLSQREQEVLELLIDGHSNKDIAEALTVSVNTVKKHLQGIYSKFNVESRAAAVAKALGRE
jgi:ATP/maltotriose-dependent transcriptional regulator MalT